MGDSYFIHDTSVVDEGAVMCVDSAWYPPTGAWRWGSTSFVLWGGPYCYETMDPGILPPVFHESTPDTIVFNTCGTVGYQFIGVSDPLN